VTGAPQRPRLTRVERRRLRRRRQRRRLGGLVLTLALVVGVAVLVVQSGGGSGGAKAGHGPDGQTLINGPATAGIGTLPLAVKLNTTNDPVHVVFHKPPTSGLLFDLDTGEVLWRRDPTRVLAIASLTKMMTAIVVVGREPRGAKVRVTKEALAYQGSAVGILPRGKRIKLETMLNGLLLPSGNDAAIALAQRVSGTVRRFVRAMNVRAHTYNLSCTHFSSPDGFVDAGNHSCAVDLAALARAVLDRPRLARIVRRRSVVLPFPVKGGRISLFNNNPLLKTGYPGTIGVKTGLTNASGHCLVGAAERNGRRLGVILLHSPNIGDQGRKLLDAGFALTAAER